MTIDKAFTTVICSYTNKIKHLDYEQARGLYLDYFNNFGTVARFAEYYEITYDSAKTLIDKCRELE